MTQAHVEHEAFLSGKAIFSLELGKKNKTQKKKVCY